MKKLLGLLSAMTLLIAPTSSLVACGAPVHINPGGGDDGTAPDPTIVLAQLKSEIYSDLVKQYQGKKSAFTKSLDDSDNGNAWINPATMKKLFEDVKKNPNNDNKIDLSKEGILSDQDKKDISSDIGKAIDPSSLGEAINNIVKGNKWYDSAIAGVPNRQIFKGINVTPVSLGELITTDSKEVQLYQFAAQVSVEYSVYTNGKVQDVPSSKINISFIIASQSTLLNFINWANDAMPKYVYGATKSPLRMSNDDIDDIENIDPVGGKGTEVPNLKWNNQLSSTYVNFEDKIHLYINEKIIPPLQDTLKEILSQPDKYGGKDLITISSDANIVIPKKDDEYANDFIFGSRVNYSTVNRLNPVSEVNKELTDVYFGDYDDAKMTNDIIDKASEQYVTSAQNVTGVDDPKSHPVNLQEARLKFKNFIKDYGVEDADFDSKNPDVETDDTLKIADINGSGDEINLESIYSFGSVAYTGVAIQFVNLTGTFDLDMRLPWSFSFKEINEDKDGKPVAKNELNRSQDFAGLLEVLLTYRANMRYKFFVDTLDNKHAFNQRYLYYRDPNGKDDFSQATNNEDATKQDAYSTWNAIARLKKYEQDGSLDGFNFGYNTFGHSIREKKSLVGFAQTNAALNLSDADANKGGYGDWVNRSPGQYNFNFYNEAWHIDHIGIHPMPYKVVDEKGWTDPSKWAVRIDPAATADDFEWWVVPNDLAHFDSAWSQADLKNKKTMKIFDREIIPYDYLFDPNALALIDTDYPTKQNNG